MYGNMYLSTKNIVQTFGSGIGGQLILPTVVLEVCTCSTLWRRPLTLLGSLITSEYRSANTNRAWREGISSSTMPLYPTRGRWLPYRWHDMEKVSFPPPSAHFSGGRWFKPRDWQKLFCHIIQLLAWRDDILAIFQFHFLHKQLARCYLEPSFSSSFFLLNL